VLYGMPFLAALGCPRLCLIVWQICLPVSGRVVALRVQSYRKWFPFALCGTYRGKEMIEILRTKRGPLEELKSFFFSLSFYLDRCLLSSFSN
jgi:hypothetical protein